MKTIKNSIFITAILFLTSCQQVKEAFVLTDYVVRELIGVGQKTYKLNKNDIFIIENISSSSVKMFYLRDNSRDLKIFLEEKQRENCKLIWSQGPERKELTVNHVAR